MKDKIICITAMEDTIYALTLNGVIYKTRNDKDWSTVQSPWLDEPETTNDPYYSATPSSRL